MDAESQLLHDAGVRNAELVLQLREKDQIIDTMNEAHKLLMAEQDAEIARLKDDNDKKQGIIFHQEGYESELKGLITELCDALEEHTDFEFTQEVAPLIQRAREATR